MKKSVMPSGGIPNSAFAEINYKPIWHESNTKGEREINDLTRLGNLLTSTRPKGEDFIQTIELQKVTKIIRKYN